MTVDPSFVSIRWSIENMDKESGLLRVLTGHAGDSVVIDINDPNVVGFLASVREDMEKINSKYPEVGERRYSKKIEDWQQEALSVIRENIHEYFGEFGDDISGKGLTVNEKSVNDIIRTGVEQSSNEKLNQQVLDCNPAACLMAYALAEVCPDRQQDFMLFTSYKFSTKTHNDFYQGGRDFPTINLPDGSQVPLVELHTSVVIPETGTVIDVMENNILKRMDGSRSLKPMDECSVYNVNDGGNQSVIIYSFDDKIYKEEAGRFVTNEIYSQRVMQIKAGELLLNSFRMQDKMYSEDELKLKRIAEGFVNGDEEVMRDPQNTALLVLAYEVNVLKEGMLTLDEFQNILLVKEHSSNDTELIFGENREDLANAFAGVEIKIRDRDSGVGSETEDTIVMTVNGERYSIHAEVPGSRNDIPVKFRE